MLTLIAFFISNSFAAININTATASELEGFSGVGAATAAKIIDFRDANGPFQSCDDLIKISGIGQKKLEQIKPDCEVSVPEVKKGKRKAKKSDSDAAKAEGISAESSQGKGKAVAVPKEAQKDSDSAKIDINKASAKELEQFSGVGPKTAEDIVDYREKVGGFESCDDLIKVKGIGDAKLSQILHQCTTSPVK
ncbi:MAG: hypothetical protein CMK59_11905 [Proteobacteria bacterium]|nr:hypothetical protein [Pseudomonadota bacterium]